MQKEDSTYHGTFQVHGHDIWGQIKLAGPQTHLTMRTEECAINPYAPTTIHGRLHDFRLVSCLQCVGGEYPAEAWGQNGATSTSWNIQPHQVLIGPKHFEPTTDRVRKAWFSTPDIYHIFDDMDSYGIVFKPSTQQQSIIPQAIGNRLVPLGPSPVLAYFAGRTSLLTSQLAFGKFNVLSSVGRNASSRGVTIDAKIWLQLEFNEPVDLELCLERIRAIGQFLSIIAGRSQGIERLHIEMDGDDDKSLPIDVHWVLGPRQSEEEQYEPSWHDIPLDGVRRPEEFTKVIQKWFDSDEQKPARARLYSCLEAGSSFTPDRLVAAANLFDLSIGSSPEEISPELAQAKEECLRILRATPRSDDRDGAIQALHRIGSLTLAKKILARAELLRGHFQMADLDKVLKQAILFRNYFVHGSSDTRFKYEVVEPYHVFLTETLEFVFAAADLIECGWAGGIWYSRPHTANHWFTRYLSDYDRASRALLAALDKDKRND